MNNFMKAAMLMLLITMCNPRTVSGQVSKGETRKLYIKSTTATGADRTTVVDSDSFEVSLGVMGVGLATYYYGSKSLEDGKSFYIVENDSIVKFKGSGEFIKYMSARGYKLVKEKSNEFDYTFKRE